MKEVSTPEQENPEIEKVEQNLDKQRSEVKENEINDIEDHLEPKEHPEECKSSEGLYVTNPEYLDENKRIKWDEYAPNDGFDGEISNTSLKEGDVVQRYGNENGMYVAPEGTPYNQLSLPYEKDSVGEPKTYVVKKDIDDVQMGKVAPAFDQEGGGTQYKLPDRVKNLEEDGYLKEVD